MLWLGLEKDEKDWIQAHIDENVNGAISIYAETVKNSRFLLLFLLSTLFSTNEDDFCFQYENQAYAWTSRRWSSDGVSRPTFSDSTGKVNTLNVSTLFGAIFLLLFYSSIYSL
jgi:hypothetical protein